MSKWIIGDYQVYICGNDKTIDLFKTTPEKAYFNFLGVKIWWFFGLLTPGFTKWEEIVVNFFEIWRKKHW